MNQKHIEINLDGNIFDQIIENITEEYGEKIKRITKMKRENSSYYFTIVTQNYIILEIKMTMIKGSAILYGLPAFETEVTAY